eukprot:Amastigsp_a510135_16.p2 type:complete len:251 gc:universal Amastigsp_a510135_16:1196-444(-)
MRALALLCTQREHGCASVLQNRLADGKVGRGRLDPHAEVRHRLDVPVPTQVVEHRPVKARAELARERIAIRNPRGERLNKVPHTDPVLEVTRVAECQVRSDLMQRVPHLVNDVAEARVEPPKRTVVAHRRTRVVPCSLRAVTDSHPAHSSVRAVGFAAEVKAAVAEHRPHELGTAALDRNHGEQTDPTLWRCGRALVGLVAVRAPLATRAQNIARDRRRALVLAEHVVGVDGIVDRAKRRNAIRRIQSAT